MNNYRLPTVTSISSLSAYLCLNNRGLIPHTTLCQLMQTQLTLRRHRPLSFPLTCQTDIHRNTKVSSIPLASHKICTHSPPRNTIAHHHITSLLLVDIGIHLLKTSHRIPQFEGASTSMAHYSHPRLYSILITSPYTTDSTPTSITYSSTRRNSSRTTYATTTPSWGTTNNPAPRDYPLILNLSPRTPCTTTLKRNPPTRPPTTSKRLRRLRRYLTHSCNTTQVPLALGSHHKRVISRPFLVPCLGYLAITLPLDSSLSFAEYIYVGV